MSKYIALGAIIITVLLPFVFLYKKKENLVSSPDTIIMGFKEFIDLYNIAPEKYQLYDYWAERCTYYYFDCMTNKKVFKPEKLEDYASTRYISNYKIIRIRFNKSDTRRYHKWRLREQNRKNEQENVELQAIFIASAQEDINKFYKKVGSALKSKNS